MLAVSASLLAGVLLVLQAYTLSRTVDRAFLHGAALPDVSDLLLALLIIALLRAGLLWAGEVLARSVASRIKLDLRKRLVDHITALGPAYTRGERSGELIHTAAQGIEELDAYFSQYLPQLALAALIPLAMLLLVFPLDPLSGLILLLTAPLIPFFMILIGSLADSLTRKQWGALSRLSAHFLDVLNGLTTLKILGRSRDQAAAIAEVSDQFRAATMNVLRVAFLSALVLEMLSTLSTALVAVQIGLRLLYGHLSFQEAFFVLILAPEFYLPLRLLGTRFHAGMSGGAAARRIFAVLDFPSPVRHAEHAPGEGKLNAAAAFSRGEVTIHFAAVRLAYDSGKRPALNGVSFTIMPGSKTALVGPSGAGKSTIVQLLLRFIEPNAGQITVNGLPLSDLPADGWREQIAWVPQLPYLFNASVADNIRLGRPNATLDDVIRAALLAHAYDFIRALPQGYDTMIGERGARLSGGQARRIALARAFLKDAPLLILDEPTSSLDLETEAVITELISRLMQGRTALIVAHRLSTVRDADQIIVLDQGRVVQTGTHTDLIAVDGLYHQLSRAYTAALPSPARHAEHAPGEGKRNAASSRFAGVRSALPAPAWKSEETPPFSRHAEHAPGEGPGVRFRLFRLAAPFRWWMLLAALLGFATIGSSIGLMSIAAWVIATAALHPSIAVLDVAIVGVRFFGITRGVFRYLERLVSHETTFRLLARLRVWFYELIEPLAPARLMSYRSGDLLARVVSDIDTLQNFYLRVIAPPAVALLVGSVMFIFFAAYDLRLALAQIGVLALAGIGVPILTRTLGRRAGSDLIAARSDLYAALVDHIQGLPDLLAYGAQHSGQTQRHSHRLATANRHMAHIDGMQTALMSLLAVCAVFAVLLLTIPAVRAGHTDGVMIAVFVLAAITSFEAVLPLPAAFGHLETTLAAARRLFELVDAAHIEPQTHSFGNSSASPSPRSFAWERGSGGEGIAVHHLSFRYDPAAPLVLDDIRFTLRPGGTLAVVGVSGAGKSTLVNLLLRFWNVPDGMIGLDGRDINDYSPEEARAFFSVVAQNTTLFNGTIRDNLLLAQPTARQDDLIQAAQQAQLHDFVKTLPHSYDTWIGEGGLNLSGGERQRIAIARAVLKNAPVLILDEATANLDPITEQDIQHAFQTALPGRSKLIITHRLIGLESADEILVLHEGRIVERGRHSDLLEQPGRYRRMWDAQNEFLNISS